MDKNTRNSKKTSRRSFAKAAATALAAVPFIPVILPAREQRRDDATDRQSSPITIGGGGSVGIDFNERYKPGLSKSAFIKTGDTLHKLWLIDRHGALENITPPSEKCEVRIQCKRSGKISTIKVTGNPLGIEFDTTEFRKIKPDDGKKEIYFNKHHKIEKIEVFVQGVPQPTAYNPPTGKKCMIVVVNTL